MADLNKGGRPRNLSAEQVANLLQKFEQYINETDIPIIAEFAYQNEINRQTLYDYDEFSTLIKICIDKKEAQLERKALQGEVNPTVAIFSLKQLGWKDRQEIDQNIGNKDGKPFEVANSLSQLSVDELRKLASLANNKI